MKQWRSMVPKRESGQAVLEYALVLALVAVGLLVGLLLFRSTLGNAYGRMTHRVQAPRSGDSESGAIAGDSGGRTAAAGPDGERAGVEQR